MLVLGIIPWLLASLPHKDAWYSALASPGQWFSVKSASYPRSFGSLELSLVFTIRGVLCNLVCSGDSAWLTSYSVQGSSPQQRIIWSKMSTVPKLRNPLLSHGKLPPRALSARHIVGTLRFWVAIIITHGGYYGTQASLKCFLRQSKGPTFEIYENSYIV